MAKVYLDEVDALLGSGATDTLNTDATEATNVNQAITDFVTGSKDKLVGASWDKYRTNLESIGAALQSRIALAQKLGAAIKEALQILKDYLGDDLMLDTSKLEEYKLAKQNCENSIAKLNEMLSATTTQTYTDTNGQQQTRTVALYDASDIKAQIAEAETTLKELDRLITKIEGFEPVYQKAEAILQAAFEGLPGFKEQVNSISPSRTVTYKPATTV